MTISYALAGMFRSRWKSMSLGIVASCCCRTGPSSRPLLDLVDVVGDQAVGFPVDVGGGLGRWGLD